MQGTAGGPVVVPPKSVAAVRDALKDCQQEPRPEVVRSAAERAYATGGELHAFGRVIVVATVTGELHFFENTGAPQWV